MICRYVQHGLGDDSHAHDRCSLGGAGAEEEKVHLIGKLDDIVSLRVCLGQRLPISQRACISPSQPLLISTAQCRS